MKTIQFKAERERVLVPVGMPCRFGCKYCYTRGGEVGPARADMSEILKAFKLFVDDPLNDASFHTIQLGYDGDPFDDSKRGLALLAELAQFNKDIDFSTKAFIEGTVLEQLARINHTIAYNSNALSAIVSLSCWDSANTIEPHTPTPRQRMQTLANLRSIGIPTFIAIRPILPNVNNKEYEQLIEEGMLVGNEGFILGPLYSDDKGLFTRFIPPEVLKQTPYTRKAIGWSPHSLVWNRYEDEARLQHIKEMIETRQGKVFLSSADAVAEVGQKSALLC